jgi:hypothetical protein
MKKLITPLIISTIATIIFTITLTTLINVRYSLKKVYVSCKSEANTNPSTDCFYVLKESRIRGNNYVIVVGKYDEPYATYGHVLSFPYISGIYLSTEDEIVKTNVEWTEMGLEATLSDGHKLFIPKSAYENGR